jgi:hypothetical protein
VSAPRRPSGAHAGGAPATTALHTTELRWFLPGPLPEEVRRWFTGPLGVVEERRDSYLLVGRSDTGVKYRGGETLELKVRQQVGRGLELGGGLVGRPEDWRKWTPADPLVGPSPVRRWVDVDKAILKRRFSLDGTEQVWSGRQDGGPACDIEVVDVRVDAVAMWTFALTAFGPRPTRRAALVAGWEGLTAATSGHAPSGLTAARALSYPEWLAGVFDDGCARHPGLRQRVRAACEH